MTQITDLVMPKLGLTMTEGRIAEWKLQRGERFARGAVVAVIETDKIANEIEAPAAGTLVDVLAAAGEVHPVGVPIARWQLDGAEGRVPSTPRGLDTTVVPEHAGSAPTVAPQLPVIHGDRIVATPYARRLAREGAVPLSAVAGSGPGGRIRGADVVKVLTARSAQAVTPAVEVRDAAGRPDIELSSRPNVSLAVIVRDGTELQAVADRFGSGKAVNPIYVLTVLAAHRVLREQDQSTVFMGIESAAGSIVTVGLPARLGLGALVHSLQKPEVVPQVGALLVLAAPPGITLFTPSLPDGWAMTLGLAMSANAGRLELSLGLSYDSARIGHGEAHRLLLGIGQSIEDPLPMLAG